LKTPCKQFLRRLLPVTTAVACVPLVSLAANEEVVSEPVVESGCSTSSCHGGIEAITSRDSVMMQSIFARGAGVGDPEGCVVCHGGDPEATVAEDAHRGSPELLQSQGGPQGFYPDPGSPWVNSFTCGTCHPDQVGAQWNSLMMTEAGKIQGTAWSFGALTGYEAKWGNYEAHNPADPSSRLGTDAYRAIMRHLAEKEPGAFPEKLEPLPEGITDLSTLTEHPEQSVFTYLRNQCQRCHTGVRGREERGDYRGMGCSSCHIPYGNEGFYEGEDPSIPREEPRHLLVHTLQSTREKTVTVHGRSYSGIPVETCTTCHDRGKRIGVSYQGLMESAYDSPFTEGGGGQLALHSKHYIAMQEDVHYQKGMLCQDCHTSIDVHGDGFIAGCNLAQVQIECADCHGTPGAFPWELPLGFQDEFGETPQEGPPRGVADRILPYQAAGTVHPREDGYLLTARGNPYPEVVRRGDEVVVHAASGRDLVMKPLKLLEQEKELSVEARTAMVQVGAHLDRMECYTCHSSWAPQCYGCHVRIDYSEGKRSFDWVAAGRNHASPEHAAEAGEAGCSAYMPGELSEKRSYLRFEDPALGVNGEGRITPVIPGCQPSVTVIGPDGETVLLNHIFRSGPGQEGSGPEGQLGIDMSPTNPHTTGRARTCESCHLSEKALGHGIAGGRIFRPLDRPTVVDLATADGEVLPASARTQLEPIEGLEGDWSRFVTESGRQTQTVGHHLSLARPLNDEERAHIDRRGICLSCHREIPDNSVAVNLLHHTADTFGLLPHKTEEHDDLVHKIMLFAAWGQVGGGVFGGVVLSAAAWWFLRRRSRRRKAEAVQ
jgi:hypothetical protein